MISSKQIYQHRKKQDSLFQNISFHTPHETSFFHILSKNCKTMNNPLNQKKYFEIQVAQHRKIRTHALVSPFTTAQIQTTKFMYQKNFNLRLITLHKYKNSLSGNIRCFKTYFQKNLSYK